MWHDADKVSVGKTDHTLKILVGKSERKKKLYKLSTDMRTGSLLRQTLRKLGDAVDWVHVAQGRFFLSSVMNFRAS
jgi:hypothetical protein